jgi:hypothetical protein
VEQIERGKMRSGLTIAELEDWELHGAIWRTLVVSDERAVVELCSCSGEPMDVVEGDRPELIEYVRVRPEAPPSGAADHP